MEILHPPTLDKEERIQDFLRKEIEFIRKQEKKLDNMAMMDYAIRMVEETSQLSLTSDEEVSEVSVDYNDDDNNNNNNNKKKDDIKSLRRQEKLLDNMTLLNYTMGMSKADLQGLSLTSDEEVSVHDEEESEDVDDE